MEPSFIADYGHETIKHGPSFAKVAVKGPPGRSSMEKRSVVSISSSAGFDAVASVDYDGLPLQHRINGDVVVATLSKLYSASELRPSSTTLVFLTHPCVSNREKERFVQACFERLGVKRLHVGYSPVMSLFGCGCTSGVVVNMGHRSSVVVPVNEGRPIQRYMCETPVGGAFQTEFLKSVLASRCGVPLAALDSSTIHALKTMRVVTPVSMSPRSDHQSLNNNNCEDSATTEKPVLFTLPDGAITQVPPPRGLFHGVGELLFNPTAVTVEWGYHHNSGQRGTAVSGIGDAARSVFRTIAVPHPLVWKECLLCGGPSLAAGTPERLKNELSALPLSPVPQPSAAIRHRAVSDRGTCSWVGASLFSQINSFHSFCCDASTFREEGPARAVRRFGSDAL